MHWLKSRVQLLRKFYPKARVIHWYPVRYNADTGVESIDVLARVEPGTVNIACRIFQDGNVKTIGTESDYCNWQACTDYRNVRRAAVS